MITPLSIYIRPTRPTTESRILREVERIPALLRLSDSALRVTSATDADGRLAALALYRLGSAARAAERASSMTPPSDSTAATVVTANPEVDNSGPAATTDELVSSAGGVRQHRRTENPDGAAMGKGVVSATADGFASESSPAKMVVVVGADIAEENEHTEDAGGDGSARARAQDIVVQRGELPSTVMKTGQVVEGGVEVVSHLSAPEATTAGSPLNSAVISQTKDGEGAMASVAAISSDELEGRGDSAHDDEDSDNEDVGGFLKEERVYGAVDIDAEEGQEEPEAIKAAAATTAAVAFDLKEVTSDQRFEQLVEIVECTADRMSVSDVSKVMCLAESATICGMSIIAIKCFSDEPATYFPFPAR